MQAIIQVSKGKEVREREFRAGKRAAREFKKEEVILIFDIEGLEKKEGITFKQVPIHRWLLDFGF